MVLELAGLADFIVPPSLAATRCGVDHLERFDGFHQLVRRPALGNGFGSHLLAQPRRGLDLVALQVRPRHEQRKAPSRGVDGRHERACGPSLVMPGEAPWQSGIERLLEPGPELVARRRHAVHQPAVDFVTHSAADPPRHKVAVERQLAQHDPGAHSEPGQRNVHIPPREKGLLVEGSSNDNVTHCEPDRNVARIVFGPAFCLSALSINRKNAHGPSALMRTGGGGGRGCAAGAGVGVAWFPAIVELPGAAVAAGAAALAQAAPGLPGTSLRMLPDSLAATMRGRAVPACPCRTAACCCRKRSRPRPYRCRTAGRSLSRRARSSAGPKSARPLRIPLASRD